MIVDEAAQGIEVSTLIPLKYGKFLISKLIRIKLYVINKLRVQKTYSDW